MPKVVRNPLIINGVKLFTLQVGCSMRFRGGGCRVVIKPKAGSRTCVTGLFRCADSPGGWVCLPVFACTEALQCRSVRCFLSVA